MRITCIVWQLARVINAVTKRKRSFTGLLLVPENNSETLQGYNPKPFGVVVEYFNAFFHHHHHYHSHYYYFFFLLLFFFIIFFFIFFLISLPSSSISFILLFFIVCVCARQRERWGGRRAGWVCRDQRVLFRQTYQQLFLGQNKTAINRCQYVTLQ